MPVFLTGRFIVMMNVLHEAGYLTGARVAALQPWRPVGMLAFATFDAAQGCQSWCPYPRSIEIRLRGKPSMPLLRAESWFDSAIWQHWPQADCLNGERISFIAMPLMHHDKVGGVVFCGFKF
jgi:hypothetical protein